jgi:hypothetical protein
MVICKPESQLAQGRKGKRERAPNFKVMKLVVDIEREIFDPVACTLVLVVQAHEKQRVQRVDNEAAKEEGSVVELWKSETEVTHYPTGPLGLMLDPLWLIGW